MPKEIIDLFGNWAPTVGSATVQTNYVAHNSGAREQAALALGGWDQSHTQAVHYPLLRKSIRTDEAMRTLQDQWLHVIMPGLWDLQHALQRAKPHVLSAAAPTHFKVLDLQAMQNTCDALMELGRVYLNALPLQITRQNYPLKDLPEVQAVICSPGWGEYSRQVLYLEKRSGGDVLNDILVLQREQDMNRQGPLQVPAAAKLVHTTERLPATDGTEGHADGPAVQHTTSSAAQEQLHMQQRGSLATPATDTVLQVPQQSHTSTPQGLPAANTLLVTQASGIPHAPRMTAQPAFPGQIDVATMQHNVAMASQQHAGGATAAAPAHAAQTSLPVQVDMASMQHTMAMVAQQHAARAIAAAPAPVPAPAATAQQHKQPAYKAFRLEGNETCSQLYAIFQHGINGSPSWRQHKAQVEAHGMRLHPADRT